MFDFGALLQSIIGNFKSISGSSLSTTSWQLQLCTPIHVHVQQDPMGLIEIKDD